VGFVTTRKAVLRGTDVHEFLEERGLEPVKKRRSARKGGGA
jgi:hypothetical protein